MDNEKILIVDDELQDHFKVFSIEQVYENVWAWKYIKCRKYCFNSHKKLREKIEDDNKNPKYIETVWGVGYKINQ